MTFRDLLDSLAVAPVSFRPPFLPGGRASRRHLLVRVDNRHGVPATYEWSRQHSTGRFLPGVQESDRLLGIPSLRTLRIPLDATVIGVDHRIAIRANGRTSKLILYGESMAESLQAGKSLAVWARIAPNGSVRFEVGS